MVLEPVSPYNRTFTGSLKQVLQSVNPRRRRFNWRTAQFIINRYTERFRQCNTIIQNGIDTAVKQENITTNENKKLVENIKFDELLNFSLPKPLDEIPLVDDMKNIEFHPAEFIDTIGPPLPVSFNLAAYVNHSEALQQLVKLGVDLSVMDRSPEKAKFILQLDFEKHIKKHIQFLHDIGVENNMLGKIITKNPFIFKENLKDLEIRINYLKSKKFSADAIAWIITRNSSILNMSTKRVDSRLGFFQKQFSLTGDEVRHIITKCSKLVSYDHKKFLEKMFIAKEEFGFTGEEMKKLLVMKPKIWMLSPRVIKERFDIVHNIMGLSHERILEYPGVFLKRTFLLKERHEYLVYLQRVQYDPSKPNFVSLYDIATTTDYAFCKKCAYTSVDQYNEFLKTR